MTKGKKGVGEEGKNSSENRREEKDRKYIKSTTKSPGCDFNRSGDHQTLLCSAQ